MIQRSYSAKSTLDGIIAIILTANLGIGVALSAVSVLLYQGTLTLLAGGTGTGLNYQYFK